MKFIFFWLVKLRLFAELFINFNYTKIESYSSNGEINNRVDISNKVDNEILCVNKLPLTNPNWSEIEIYDNHYNICNIVGKKIYFIKKI